MDNKLTRAIELKNGLTLEIYDLSRKTAGDRWLVKMLARIDIPTDILKKNHVLNEQVSPVVLKANLGDFIRFEQTRELNFVGDLQKDAIFNDLVESYLASTRKYLSHPNFATRHAERERLRISKTPPLPRVP